MLRTPRYAEQGQGGGWGWEGGTRRELTVASSRLTTLDKLVVPSGTRRLDLRENALLSLDSDSGRPPWPGQLEEVDLSGNRLVVLRGLGSHAHLHTLNLSNNSLLRLDGHVLSQLPRLASLNISQNSLSSIDEVVACRHTLRQLTASHNSLTQLPAIAHCSALQELDLGKNMIAALGDIPDRLPRSLRWPESGEAGAGGWGWAQPLPRHFPPFRWPASSACRALTTEARGSSPMSDHPSTVS